MKTPRLADMNPTTVWLAVYSASFALQIHERQHEGDANDSFVEQAANEATRVADRHHDHCRREDKYPRCWPRY